MRTCTHDIIGNKELIAGVGLRGGRPVFSLYTRWWLLHFFTKYTYCCLVAKSYRWLRWLLKSHGLEPTRLLSPWDFLGKNTWVGCHSLLQGIFPIQETQTRRRILYHLHHQGSWCAVLCCVYLLSLVWPFAVPCMAACQAPLFIGILQARILEWVAMPSTNGSSQLRDWT